MFTADWLNLRISRADPYLQHLLREQINALEFRFCDDLPGQVRSVLRSALLTDHARSDQAAELFSIHERTLRRRLNDRGTSFQERLDEGRFGIARQMLQDTGMEVSQISEALGHADASTFIRAFRRWGGCTPARWRTERLAKVNSPDWAQSCFQIAKPGELFGPSSVHSSDSRSCIAANARLEAIDLHFSRVSLNFSARLQPAPGPSNLNHGNRASPGETHVAANQRQS